MADERLQKLLARAGVASRRSAESLITAGHVRVNGRVVTTLGEKADPARDRIEVRGRPLSLEAKVYYLVHKPRAMVTTLSDPEGRPSLGDMLAAIPERVYPVGRLDFHTSGALLVTNDGDLAQGLLHPSRQVPKTYVAKINVELSPRQVEALRQGVTLDDGYHTRPARVSELRVEDGKTWLEITISEGKNRQIHRMAEAIGVSVMRLSRVSFAGLSTEGMRPQTLRPLTTAEISQLRRLYLSATQERGAAAASQKPSKKAAAKFDSRQIVGHKKGPT